jgi:predicted TIM-barrel fold metal-dependent hydrolase
MIADVQVIADQLVALSPLLERASVRVHVDHCGRPDPTAGIDAPGFRELLRWGRTGWAVVKLSGCVKVSREPYPHADLFPFIRALVSEFGPDHCVWASDPVPGVRLSSVSARNRRHRLRPRSQIDPPLT